MHFFQSENREMSAGLSSFSPFCSLLESSPRDGATHIQGASSLLMEAFLETEIPHVSFHGDSEPSGDKVDDITSDSALQYGTE